MLSNRSAGIAGSIQISKIKLVLRLFVSVVFLMLVSCVQKPRPQDIKRERVFPGYHALLDEVVRSRAGVFRGVALGSTSGQVKVLEPEQPTEETDGHLFYEYRVDSLTDFSIDYGFDNDSLSEINVQINCKDIDLSSYLFCDLKDYYAHKLPNPKEDKGFVVYNCFEGQRMPFVISLSDNSTMAMGIINMVIYKDK